jgi:hypothetical protein
MDSVTGWCLRLISLFLWVLLLVASFVAPALVLGVSDANQQVGSALFALLTPYVCTLVPICLEWLMCQQTFEWSSLDWMLSKKWTRMPFWRVIVSLKSWKRLLLKLLHCAAASLCGALYITTAGKRTSSSSTVPFWLMLTFGAVHAAAYNVRGGDRVVYPAIHLSRPRRMMDAILPAGLDSSFVWTRAALLSTVLFFVTPTPLISFFDMISAIVASMVYSFSLAACGKLVHFLLSERLYRKDIDLDHSVVRP